MNTQVARREGILFDARWITPGMTGVGRVAQEILRGIPGEERPKIGIILTGRTQDVLDSADLAGFRIHRTRVALTSHPLSDLFEQIAIPALCYRYGYKAFVSFEGRLPAWHSGFKTFGYVHDATFIGLWRHNGLKYSALLWGHLAAMRACATGIITVSHAAKARLLKAAKLRADKVFVVHNADSGLDRVKAALPPNMTERPYVLAVGMTNPRKNFSNLVRAFAIFNRNDTHELVVTGARHELEPMLRREPLTDRVRLTGFVTDGELRHLYENAACLAYPSLEEGFGIPLLDAALTGTAVACSDLAVFREVLGNDAAYFDPHDPESIARGLTEATSPTARRADPKSLRERFSWELSARALLSLARTGTVHAKGLRANT